MVRPSRPVVGDGPCEEVRGHTALSGDLQYVQGSGWGYPTPGKRGEAAQNSRPLPSSAFRSSRGAVSIIWNRAPSHARRRNGRLLSHAHQCARPTKYLVHFQ
ncbi:hypothetical protein P280DRAFT_250393 [Massarina eburnea CBS 473.64]|uniref:Uncharacterized protein n=1 Tax=Massarina eburnea CBS 473.64 TaxID=1395130 RepID=A0A6A6S818_9PLEO|nr:hypothetical protein P280DRAFT_250393 [Massarina eburnea CBS 473.64]